MTGKYKIKLIIGPDSLCRDCSRAAKGKCHPASTRANPCKEDKSTAKNYNLKLDEVYTITEISGKFKKYEYQPAFDKKGRLYITKNCPKNI